MEMEEPLNGSSDKDTVLLVPRFSDNQSVLACTCILFFAFCVAETMGALISNSLSLLGDAAAMFVDV